MRRVLLIVVLGLFLAGCGGEETVAPTGPVVGTLPQAEKGDPAAGKTVFTDAGCGGCHTLAAAGSSGTVGPNLDESQPTLELAIDRITNGRGGMPSFEGQLSEEQIRAVASFVAENRG